ncbi:hypothetical protein IPM62_00135 [Candidatus Woesebacteria bacterium]|nr:MAG: hypothetical protein IPM62_00135 [Candidatus Woesebacteria bacterium]
MGSDSTYILWWWFLFLFLSLSSLPLMSLLFQKFLDVGYGFSKTLGLLFVSYLVFLVSIFKIAPFTQITIVAVFILYALFNLIIYTRHKKTITDNLRIKIRIIVAQEIIFTTGYLYWVLVRGYQPDINGLEKFMDFGFINSILNSTYLPPKDMWFSGSSINYYWFGHYVTALITKISFIPSSVTYNLMLATIMGLTLNGAFSISGTLVTLLGSKVKIRYAFAAGILSALMLTFAGNFHTLFFYGRSYYQSLQSTTNCSTLNECIESVLNHEVNYWYPDATRFIGYDPETNDKTIHEFPMYSFVVSDLHAHLLNLPFVLLLLALLTKFVFVKNKLFNLSLAVLPVGVLLGIFFMTNTWDVGNYLLVTGLVLGILNLHYKLLNQKKLLKALFLAIYETLILLIVAIIVAVIVFFPFYVNFISIAQGLDFVKSYTPVWQLLVLWGLPIMLTLSMASVLVKSKKISNITRVDVYVFSLLIASLILIVIPEVVFLKDIYSATHHRANTMFKLTYQAFVLSYLVSGYVAIRATLAPKKKASKIGIIIFFGIIYSLLLQYPRFSIDSYYAKLQDYKGTAGDTWLKYSYPDEYNIIQWLNSNKTGQPTILEAPGDSYTDFNVISSYTGLPTVSGWYVHEWLWRGDASFPQNRVNDIAIIYTSPDVTLVKSLLEKYQVKYIIVGTFERQKYLNVNTYVFEGIAKKVFQSGASLIYEVI